MSIGLMFWAMWYSYGVGMNLGAYQQARSTGDIPPLQMSTFIPLVILCGLLGPLNHAIKAPIE